MTVRRLLCTAARMAAGRRALRALTGPLPRRRRRRCAARPAAADTAGPEAVVVAAAGLLAWAVWAWGAARPAAHGRLGRCPGCSAARSRAACPGCVLPAGLRRRRGLALGVGLVVGRARGRRRSAGPRRRRGPGLARGAPTGPTGRPARAARLAGRPRHATAAAATGTDVVVAGDCLWRIAEDRLAADGPRPHDRATSHAAVDRWWSANADVIGPDPDLILPGQVLRPPTAPTAVAPPPPSGAPR